jgi:hypothetical protein
MQTVPIGSLSWSKVICGTNAFYARSHFSRARDQEYRSRFDDAGIEAVLRRCLQLGMSAVESSANERIVTIVNRLRGGGSTLHLAGSTRIDETSPMKTHADKLSFLIGRRAELCIVHAQYVDSHRCGDEISGLDRFLDDIHAAGLLAGISTHRVSTVELCEKNRCAIDAYLFPLNMTGFVYPGYDGGETVRQRVDLVRGVNKPFILMKALAAGRIPPAEGLPFVLENSKKGDLISLGIGGVAELDESVSIVERHLAK